MESALDTHAKRIKMHALRAQIAELRRSPREEAHDAANSLERDLGVLKREIRTACLERITGGGIPAGRAMRYADFRHLVSHRG